MNYKLHPWHGVSPYTEKKGLYVCFIEIVTKDTVKYEIDKVSGYLKIDRPQKFSNVTPALYGFIPRTYCGQKVAERCMVATNASNIVGDGDPIDVLVLTEHHIPHGDILVRAIPIGGLRMIDKEEADDKILAVLEGDALYGNIRDISQLPSEVLMRLQHYFLTYKQLPDGSPRKVEIAEVYGAVEAAAVIQASLDDYKDEIAQGDI